MCIPTFSSFVVLHAPLPSPWFACGSSPDTMKQLPLRPHPTSFGDKVHVETACIPWGMAKISFFLFLVFSAPHVYPKRAHRVLRPQCENAPQGSRVRVLCVCQNQEVCVPGCSCYALSPPLPETHTPTLKFHEPSGHRPQPPPSSIMQAPSRSARALGMGGGRWACSGEAIALACPCKRHIGALGCLPNLLGPP